MSVRRGGLTVGQQALWLLYRQDPAGAAYNVMCALHGTFDAVRLAEAVRVAGGRHDLVRSAFAEDASGPHRLVHDTALVRLEVRDLPGASRARLAGAARTAGLEPFRLERDGAFRAVLFRGADEHLLLVAGHHVATDAMSQCGLVRHILDAYADLTEGRVPQSEPLPSFERQVERERALQDTPRFTDHERHWRRVCAGAPTLELPVDRPRPRRARTGGRTHELRLDPALVTGVRDAAARASTTPFAVMLTAFRLLLHRYTGERDIVLGCPVGVRRAAGLRETVGYYVNPVVLRAEIAADTSAADLLAAAHTEVRDATAHQDLPFPLLPGVLGVRRDPARAPLFQITFTLVATGRLDPVADLLAGGVREIEYRGMRLAACDLDQQEGQFDLAVEVLAGSGGTRVLFRYRDDLYEPETMRRLGRHYVRLLSALAGTPPDEPVRPPAPDAEERAELMALGRVRSRT
ncbi:condensation domain-containing protein [Actinomadura harenae]|uniref:condensation domain-containing protein n=1 Tax=Actinomadura harenae TaxID=2483351 RepID=UPI0013154573|nr:condensation domain-containing protein [Actinomadura harenae]